MARRVVTKKFSCDDLPKRCFTYFDELRSEKQLCDFTFSVGEVPISAHRVILAAAIPYYRNMFSKGIDEIPDVEPNMLACLIDYAYTHEVSIDTSNVTSLLAAAGQLGIHEVKQACCDFLSDGLEPETVRNDWELENRFDSMMLLEAADCDIQDNSNVTSETRESLNYPVTNLKHLADKDDRNVEQEEVLDGVLCLVKDSSQDRKNGFPDLQWESSKQLERPQRLWHVQSADLPPERRQALCSNITQPRTKRKEVYASNEKIQNPCIYKLNVEEIYTVQCFNLLQDEWITENSEALFTFSGSAVPFQKEKVHFFRSATTLQYDPRDNSFESMSCMPTSRDFFGETALGNRIYICGGRIGYCMVTNAVECFYPAIDLWETVEPMPTHRLCLSAVTLDDCIFAIGGRCEDTVYSTVEKYNPIHDEWTSKSPMLDNRWAAGAATLNGSIYVCGGISLNEDAVSSCEVYYPNDDKWVRIPPLNSTRCFFSLLSFQQKLHAIGGCTNQKIIHVVDIYNPENNGWTFGPATDREFVTSSAFVVPVVDA